MGEENWVKVATLPTELWGKEGTFRDNRNVIYRFLQKTEKYGLKKGEHYNLINRIEKDPYNNLVTYVTIEAKPGEEEKVRKALEEAWRDEYEYKAQATTLMSTLSAYKLHFPLDLNDSKKEGK